MGSERFLIELRARLARFDLELHPANTRLIEFGRVAAHRRRERGESKPETFNFIGFMHICSKTRQGWYSVLRQTMRSQQRTKLKDIDRELPRRRHVPIEV